MRKRLRILNGIAIVIIALAPVPSAQTADAENYVILYGALAVPADAELAISNAGGMLVARYDELGVAIARSDLSTFREDLLLIDKRIEGASATSGFWSRLSNVDVFDSADAGGPPAGDLPNAPATDADSLSLLQWDMRQIHSPEAHAITGGSPSVLVGVLDTGIDYTHPDLAPNIDLANTVSCVSGVAVPGAAALDDNGHGTHTAGTIAAASNGIGIVGVAPNVHIAGIKVGNSDGFFFPEAVICGFYWAATHGFSVVNNSYFADPYKYNCRNDATQRAIWKAEQRAILFAQRRGVTVVASQGNDSDDRTHPAIDAASPDFPPGAAEEREITNACLVIPNEIPGVVGVTAVGNVRQTDGDDDPDDYLKSFYSAFGMGVAQLTAPGGDSVYFDPSVPGLGRVLSTWPGVTSSNCPAPRRVVDASGALYCYLQGTSMAAPHVAGVAALVISQFGSSLRNGNMSPGAVVARMIATADPQPCPTELPTVPVNYEDFKDEADRVQVCEGGNGYTSWYGRGQVNALKAVAQAQSH